MEDRKIMRMLFVRAEGALEALAEHFGKQLHTIARNILGDERDAQECVNDTYLALWNAIPPAQPDPLCAYVCRVGRNIALKRLRSNTAQKRCSTYDLSLEELAECIGSTMEETLDERELGRSINSFLGTLSPENRRIFLRRYWFGDSVQAIANTFALSENTVSVRLSRLRGKLKDHLIKEGYYEA